MAVFFDTGGGDIYAGPTKEAVFAAMQQDMGEDFDIREVREVDGSYKMRVQDENEQATDQLVSLTDEYGDGTTAYCIASENY